MKNYYQIVAGYFILLLAGAMIVFAGCDGSSGETGTPADQGQDPDAGQTPDTGENPEDPPSATYKWSHMYAHGGDLANVKILDDGSIIVAGGKNSKLYIAKFDSSGTKDWEVIHSDAVVSEKLEIYKAYKSNGVLQWSKEDDYNGNWLFCNTYNMNIMGDGSIIIAGKVNFSRTTSSFDQDIYIARFDRDGNHQWSRLFIGSADNDVGWDITETDDDGLIMCGLTNSEEIAGNTDINSFVMKLTATGEMEWFTPYLADQYDDDGKFFDTRQIIAIENNSYYAVLDNWDYTVLKIGKNDGSVIWQYNEDRRIWSIIDDSDGLLLYGRDHETAAVVVSKINYSGQLQWSKKIALDYSGTISAFGSNCNLFKRTGNNGFIIAGTVNNKDVFVIKTDADCSKEWQKIYNNEDNTVNAVAIEQNGNGEYVLLSETGTDDDMWLMLFD